MFLWVLMQEINAEYDKVFQRLKDVYEHSQAYEQQTDRQKQAYDWKKDKQIRDAITAEGLDDDYYQYHRNPVSMSYIRDKYGSGNQKEVCLSRGQLSFYGICHRG